MPGKNKGYSGTNPCKHLARYLFHTGEQQNFLHPDAHYKFHDDSGEVRCDFSGNRRIPEEQGRGIKQSFRKLWGRCLRIARGEPGSAVISTKLFNYLPSVLCFFKETLIIDVTREEK